MKAYSRLIIVATNKEERYNNYVVWPVPKINLLEEERQAVEGATSLLTYITGLSAYDANGEGWVMIKFLGVYDDKKVTPDLNLVYSAVIPEKVALIQGYEWKKTLDIYNDKEADEAEKHLLFSMGARI